MFKEKLKLVPNLPGSYQMKDKNGIIIYVGKAKNLKKRLKSYFTGRVTGKTKILVENIANFEYIVTNSELESLILEITLIKKYNPKYNILLKDDKAYPYIELTNEKSPTLKIVRNISFKKNKNNLYGPYPNVGSARRTVNMLNRLYPLRKCDKLKKDVCLYYHLGECLGYCKNVIDTDYLNNMTKEIRDFLSGNSKNIRQKIYEQMILASDSLNFEKAKELKEMLEDIDVTIKNQIISLNKEYNFDLFNCYQEDNYLSIQVFFIRHGLLFGREKKIINTLSSNEDALTEYIIKFYSSNIIPKNIYVPSFLDCNLLSSYLKTTVETRQKGDIKDLLDLAYRNAQILLDENKKELNNNETVRLEALAELKSILKVPSVSRMEAFDNSHLFGTYYVGGMVVFRDFLPLKNEYRKYKLDVSVVDDLAAMKEVIYRRYYRVLMDNLEKPDLIVLDGGPTQVQTVVDIINDLKLDIKVIGLKKDPKHKTNCIIDQDLKEIVIDQQSHLFLFLANIQEEVHRYAISYHREIKSKGSLASILDNINGIGEKRRIELLKHYRSLKKIKEASVEELSTFIPEEVATSLKEYLKDIDK